MDREETALGLEEFFQILTYTLMATAFIVLAIIFLLLMHKEDESD
jgi:preprotein translocase subunit SecG